MRHRSVADLMTPNAVVVQPGTPFREKTAEPARPPQGLPSEGEGA